MENKPMISETEKREALKQFMAEKAKAPVCVAFSGGVDSSLILKLACDTAKKTGMPVYAVTFHTMLHPACDLEIAERVAKELGAIHKIIQVNEMELEAIRTNPVNRCYICKHHLFATLLDFAKEEGISCVMDGTNESDLHVYRPGIQALRELGVVSPLAQCGLEKKDGIYSTSRALTVWGATTRKFWSNGGCSQRIRALTLWCWICRCWIPGEARI